MYVSGLLLLHVSSEKYSDRFSVVADFVRSLEKRRDKDPSKC